MKNIFILFFFVASLSAFADINDEASLQTDNEFYSGRTHMRGEVLYGSFLNCRVLNRRPVPVIVTRYTYDVWFYDNFGNEKFNRNYLKCAYNCVIPGFTMSTFTGPRNGYNVIKARCRAHIR